MNLPENMEKVCDDVDSVWYYNQPSDTYYRVYAKTKEFTKIRGKHIPDADKLWDERIKNSRKTLGRFDALSIKPTEATFALYNHRKNMIK